VFYVLSQYENGPEYAEGLVDKQVKGGLQERASLNSFAQVNTFLFRMHVDDSKMRNTKHGYQNDVINNLPYTRSTFRHDGICEINECDE